MILNGAILVATGALLAAAGSGQPDDGSLVIEEIDRSSHPEISLVVTATAGVLEGDGDAGTLRVLENGEARPLTARSETASWLRVVLAIDASGSMAGTAIDAARSATDRFLEAMPEGTEIAVISFDGEAEVVAPFGTDTGSAAARIGEIAPAGPTALYDAVTLATEQLRGSGEGRRVVVLLSDGGDTASGSTLDGAAEALGDHGIDLHAIELEGADNDRAALDRLASAVDGTVVAATDPEGLAEVFSTVASQLVNRHRLTYRTLAEGETVITVDTGGDGRAVTATRTVVLPTAPPPPAPRPRPATTAVPPDPTPPSTAVTTAPTAMETVDVSIPWPRSRTALHVGGGGVFVALVALLLLAGAGRRRRIELAPPPATHHPGDGSRTLSRLAGRATSLAERSLDGDRRAGLSRHLEEAGLAVRPAEFAVVHLIVAVTAAALGGLAVSPVAAPFTGLLGLAAVYTWVRVRGQRRRAAFAAQLADILQLMSGGLRAGYGLMQALDSVAASVPAPAGTEFRRAKTEVQLGKDTQTALRNVATRVGSEDFRWVVDAIEIHRQVGGDLGQILDTVGDTIRDRQRIKRRIKGLAAEGRISAFILGALPIVVSAAIALINPGYFADLTGTAIGRILIGGGLLLMIAGIAWMNRITALEY